MMKLIAKHLDRPLYKIDATKLTIPGYVGTDIEEELWKLFVECGGDLEKAERAIIFIDEIDKKGSDKKDDVSGKGVLNVLLPFIEGSEYDAVDSMKHPTKKVRMKMIITYVIISIFPFIWFYALKNHSYGHHWFTYRELAISIYALSTCMLIHGEERNG